MTAISDIELVRLWLRVWKPEPGAFIAPAATVTWDGIALICEPNRTELDPAAALLCPAFAARLAHLQRRKAATVQEPSIAVLEGGYGPATAALNAEGAVVSEEIFRARLDACRGCNLWNERARDGRGSCDSVRCRCAHPLLWLAGKPCPEGLWPA
jgi:hypothetical protein